MNYELAFRATNAKTEEEFQAKLNGFLHPGEISKKALTHAMREMFPNAKVMVISSAEQQRRAALSEKMQNAMSRRLHDHFESNLSRAALNLPRPKSQFVRQIEETILNLPLTSQNDEYVKRYTTMVDGTPEQKTELLLNLFEEEKKKLADKGWTREKLKQLTNDEIADNFGDLQELMGWVGAMQYLSGSPLFNLTDEQSKEFRDFETEYDIVSWVYNRARTVSNPNYSLVRMESLPEFDNSDIDLSGILPDDEYVEADSVIDEEEEPVVDEEPSTFENAVNALQELFSAVDSRRMMARNGLQTEVERQLEGAFNTDVQWFDEQGRSLQANSHSYSYRKDQSEPPLDDLVAGRKLTAVLPNGTVKVFSIALQKDGSMQFHTEVQSKILTGEQQENAPKAQPENVSEVQPENAPKVQPENVPEVQPENAPKVQQPNTSRVWQTRVPESQLDSAISQKLRELSQGLDNADPWYIKSSPEYKNVKAALKKIQSDWRAMGKNPTDYQLDQLKEKMQSLSDVAGEYLGKKNDKKHFNDREQARKDAVSAIQTFADELSTTVINLQNERAETKQERETFSQELQQKIADRQEAMAQQREQYRNFERSTDIQGAIHSHTENKFTKEDLQAFDNKLSEIERISCPPSKEAGNALDGLRQAASDALQMLTDTAKMEQIPSHLQASIKSDMATLTLFHLIMTERSGQPAGTAGPLEQALAKQEADAMVDSIEKLPAFNNLLGDITPTHLTDFIVKDGARNIAKQLITNSRDNQKQAENPAPEKAAQKDMANPMQK